LTKAIKRVADSNPNRVSHNVETNIQTLPCIYGSRPQNEDVASAALRHAKIYCLADKLGLKELQALVITKLRLCGPLAGVDFLTVASYLLRNSYDSNGSLGTFLSSFVTGIPKQA
jgi:hypothetical protein